MEPFIIDMIYGNSKYLYIDKKLSEDQLAELKANVNYYYGYDFIMDFDMEQLIQLYIAMKQGIELEELLNPEYSPKEIKAMRKQMLFEEICRKYYRQLEHYKFNLKLENAYN